MKALVINCYKNNYYLSSLKEMDSLLKTLNIEIELVVQCELKDINRSTFISKGIVEQCAFHTLARNIDIVIFNNDLSPLQVRNLSEQLNVDVIDRSMVIIKIFEMRAKSKEAKLQVEIASLKYNATRLVEKKANYDQVTSGSGQNKGLGEKIIDLKRNQIKSLIKKKEDKLKIIQENRLINRVKRKNTIPLVAITGYTNAGKSTLMNQLIKITNNCRKDLTLEEDRLFATLDTTTRLIKVDGHCPFLLTDTVGFISNLPTHLIDSFKSTLEEIQMADLIIEVIDLSSSNFQIEQQVNEKIIKELTNKPIIKLYNKIDKTKQSIVISENELLISLKDNIYLEQILNLIDEKLSEFYYEVYLYIPYEDINIFYQLKNNQVLLDYKEDEKGISGSFKFQKGEFKKYRKYLKHF